jgi:hypothetical protein
MGPTHPTLSFSACAGEVENSIAIEMIMRNATVKNLFSMSTSCAMNTHG